MPRVSVILCAYNAERFLEAAVESVLAQTFRDFELVCVDDGSADRTAAILDAFAARDARVRVIHQPNSGQVQAAINGINASTGEIIARMDADDVCRIDRLAKQVALLDARPDVVLVGGAYDLTDEHGRRLTTIRQPEDDAALQAICLTGRCPICQPLATFRRAAYDQVGGYDTHFKTAEDLELWLRLGEVGRLACLSDVLLEYRQHSRSMSESKQARMVEDQREIVRRAWARRGVEGQYAFDGERPWRSLGDADGDYKQTLKYGWWAWNSGENATARRYGWSAVRRRPTDQRGWKLLACGLLKSKRAG